MVQESIQKDLRRLGRAFSLGYVVFVVLGTSVLLYFNHLQYSRLARSYVSASRHSLVIRDLRQAVASLSPAAKDGFLFVAISNPRGEVQVGIPNNSAAKTLSDPMVVKIEESVMSGLSRREESLIAVISFGYSIVGPLLWAGVSSICFFFVGAWFFARARKALIERHELIVTARESDAIRYLAVQVAHDIRSPLSALNVVVNKMDKTVSRESKQLIEAVAKRINGIASDLLQRHHGVGMASKDLFGGSASAVPSAGFSRVRLGSLLSSLVSEKKLAIEDRPELTLKLEISESEDAECEVDEKELCRALSNLLNNAIEAIDGAGSITVALRSAPNGVAIVIGDTGRGISKEVLERLGRERISAGKSGGESGSGLGVFHAKAVVEAMRGKFSIQSRPGVGTMVTMTFPVSSV